MDAPMKDQTSKMSSAPRTASQQSNTNNPRPSRKKLMLLGVVTVIVVFLLLGTGLFFILNNKLRTPVVLQISPTGTKLSPTIDPTGNWKTYLNTKEGYTIQYPPNWMVGDGWFTSPGGKPGYGDSDVAIFVREKTTVNGEGPNVPLERYVRDFAGAETGPERVPQHINKLTTKSGLTGYTVEWQASPWSAGKKYTLRSLKFPIIRLLCSR